MARKSKRIVHRKSTRKVRCYLKGKKALVSKSVKTLKRMAKKAHIKLSVKGKPKNKAALCRALKNL